MVNIFLSLLTKRTDTININLKLSTSTFSGELLSNQFPGKDFDARSKSKSQMLFKGFAFGWGETWLLAQVVV